MTSSFRMSDVDRSSCPDRYFEKEICMWLDSLLFYCPCVDEGRDCTRSTSTNTSSFPATVFSTGNVAFLVSSVKTYRKISEPFSFGNFLVDVAVFVVLVVVSCFVIRCCQHVELLSKQC